MGIWTYYFLCFELSDHSIVFINYNALPAADPNIKKEK